VDALHEAGVEAEEKVAGNDHLGAGGRVGVRDRRDVVDQDVVIVVPQGLARDVARYARRELDSDKAGRRRLYEDLGWPLDDTVR
jgi:hypothetical protein